MSTSSSRSRLNLAATAILALSLVVLVNFLSSRHYRRWDWTADQLFTLSDRSQQVLRELDQDIQIYVFLARGEQDFADVETLLEEYKAITPRIAVEWVDPDRDRARYQVLADRFGVDTLLAGELTLSQVPVVVTSGDRKWKVERHQLIVEDFESFDDVDGHKLDLQSERALTGAILEVTTGEPTQVCLAHGHGEWEVGAYGDRSFDAVARELGWEKIEIEPFELSREQEVPESCDALFIVSPQRLF
ncbi:MAG: Gldg family protein, partial [Polyangiales bacterium]